MTTLRLAAGVLLASITGSWAESTCKLNYKDDLGADKTKVFQCEGCCCDEPHATHCCTCWWVSVIGPCIGLLIAICAAIAFCCAFKHYKKRHRQTGALKAGQILQVPTTSKTGVENPVYSQTGAPFGGQATSFQSTWTFSSTGQPTNTGEEAPPLADKKPLGPEIKQAGK